MTLAIVVDVSASMRGKMEDAARALAELLEALTERDRTFLLGFHNWVVNLQDPTHDHSLLVEALSRVEPGGATAMFDGVVEGLYRLHKMGPRTRRALVLLSDGFDNMSVNTPHETSEAHVGFVTYASTLHHPTGVEVGRIDDKFPFSPRYSGCSSRRWGPWRHP